MKKGFTLIELLAVIVILAIIALIATPIVLNIINDSKNNVTLRSTEGYLKAVKLSLNGIKSRDEILDGLYLISEDGTKITYNKDKEIEYNIEFDGSIPEGLIYIKDGQIENIISFKYNNTMVYLTNDNKVTLNKTLAKPISDDIERNKIIVVDFDGTVLVEDELVTGQKFKLPSVPKHNRLEFQEWVSPVEIKNNEVVMEDFDIVIGPCYTTKSGKTEFDVEITDETGKKITFQNLTGVTEIDWGDGTKDINLEHSYKNYGKYIISISGNIAIGSGIFSQSSSNKNISVKNIRLSSTTTIKGQHYIFCYLDNLESISLPKNFRYGYSHFVDYCPKLKVIIIPVSQQSNFFGTGNQIEFVVVSSELKQVSGYSDNVKYFSIPNKVQSIGQLAFYGNSYIKKIVIPKSVTSITWGAFMYMKSLEKVVFNGNLNIIPSRLFEGNTKLKIIDMSKFTIIPKLEDISAFKNIHKDAKILVPRNLYEEWLKADNWNKVANNIVPV